MNFSKVFTRYTRYGPDTPALYRILNKFKKKGTTIVNGYVVPWLDISDLNIHSLPPLPDRIKDLICINNKLTSLPELPDTLEHLVCHTNQLTSLPQLPDGLEKLYCEQNQLTSLPTLPEGLRELGCGGNQITSLLPLPEGLKRLNCYKNQLTSLPSLPKGLEKLSCHHNPNLVNITGECPPSLREEPASEVFKGCPNLVPQPNQRETLGEFFDRAANPEELIVTEELIVPKGSENSIMMSEIQNGNILANFHNEKNFKRYYLKSTVNQLKENPSTRKPIQPRNIKLYTAKLNTRKLNTSSNQNANLGKLNANQYSNPNTMLNTKPTTRKRLNRGVGSRNLTKLSIGGKTRRNKKRKAKKTRRV